MLRRLGPWLRPYRLKIVMMFVTDIMALAAATVTPFVIARMIDGPIAHGDRAGLWRDAGLLLALAAAQTICFALRRLPMPDIVNIEAAIRRDLYAHLLRLPALYHDRQGAGPALSRLVGDIAMVGYALSMNLIWMASNATALLVTAAMLIVIAPVLGGAVIVALIPLGLASTIFQNRFRSAVLAARERAADVATAAEESVLAIRVLKAIGGGPFAVARFERSAGRSKESEVEKIRLNAGFSAFLSGYPVAVLALVAVGGGIAVARDAVSIGSFVAFTAFYFRILTPVNWMGQLLSTHQASIGAIIRIMGVLDTPPDIADPLDPVALQDGALGVRFDAVGFTYPGAAAKVLDGVDLDIHPGETIAIVGATGSGKTALGALVGRLADADAGQVLIGGIDVRRVALDSLRATVGMAFEDATLFSTTVRENLTLGRDGIGDAEIEAVLAVTQSGFVADLPDGLDTVVGEQGLTLSGGQRQRLALARALLGRPRILVLDDPMSALDVRTEETLERELRRSFAGITTIVIARRPSTALLADRVALLAEGRIADVGTHAELLARSAAYRHAMIAATDTDKMGAVEEVRDA